MLRLLLIFPQQLSKTCPLAKKILSLRQKYEKKEMILVIFLLRSEIAFFLDSWKSNFFFELFLNILVKFLITRKLVIKNFTRMFKKSSQKKFDFHSSRKKAISLRRKKMPLIISFFSYFCSRKILFSKNGNCVQSIHNFNCNAISMLFQAHVTDPLATLLKISLISY